MAEYDQSNSVRLKLSQERLRDLYHDEVKNSGFQVPDMPAVRMVIFVTVVTFLFISVVFFMKYNDFITMQEGVYAKAGQLEGAYQRRSNLFENLLKLTLNHAALEHEVFSRVAEVRKDIIKKLELPPEIEQQLEQSLVKSDSMNGVDLGQALAALEGGGSMEASLGRLLGLVENYPNIKSSETYAHMMSSLIEIEDRIADRRTDYQNTIFEFNRAISNFPWSLLAEFAGFKRFDYFVAEPGADKRPIISSDHFEVLLPMLSGGSKESNRHNVHPAQGVTPTPPVTEPAVAVPPSPSSAVETKPMAQSPTPQGE